VRFQLVDRFERLEPGVSAVGVKALSGTEEFLRDHFPGNPVFPGVLILESLAQTAGGLIAITTEFESFALMSLVQDVKFRDFVRPGHLLRTTVDIDSLDARAARVRGTATCEGREVARARIVFVLRPLEEVIGPRFREGWIEHIRAWASGLGPGGES
jgi:3-hydroxyacyl-[acyl-carrier-protein] dehydratase